MPGPATHTSSIRALAGLLFSLAVLVFAMSFTLLAIGFHSNEENHSRSKPVTSHQDSVPVFHEYIDLSGRVIDGRTLQQWHEHFERVYGLKVFSSLESYGKFLGLSGAPEQCLGQPLTDSELQSAMSYLDHALQPYPSPVIRQNLKAVALCRDLRVFQYPFSGTYGSNSVVCNFNSRKPGQLPISFHHEFSSILMHNYLFPFWKWKACHLPEFEYLDVQEQGRAFVQSPIRSALTAPATYELGFVSGYGLSDIENDFNTFTSAIMTEPRTFERVMASYPIIAKKYEIWRDFIRYIDPKIEVAVQP